MYHSVIQLPKFQRFQFLLTEFHAWPSENNIDINKYIELREFHIVRYIRVG